MIVVIMGIRVSSGRRGAQLRFGLRGEGRGAGLGRRTRGCGRVQEEVLVRLEILAMGAVRCTRVDYGWPERVVIVLAQNKVVEGKCVRSRLWQRDIVKVRADIGVRVGISDVKSGGSAAGLGAVATATR